MTILIAKKHKILILGTTMLLFLFSASMLFFADNDAVLKTKASSIHAPHAIP